MATVIDLAYLQMHPEQLFNCRNLQSDYVKNVTKYRNYINCLLYFNEYTAQNLVWVNRFEHILNCELNDDVLCEAARSTDVATMKWLMAKGCSYTPLASLFAVEKCKIENLQWFLDNKFKMYDGFGLDIAQNVFTEHKHKTSEIAWMQKNLIV